jgi:hypothetical protein
MFRILRAVNEGYCLLLSHSNATSRARQISRKERAGEETLRRRPQLLVLILELPLFSGHPIIFLLRKILIANKSILDFTGPEDEGSKHQLNVFNYLPVQTVECIKRLGICINTNAVTSYVSNQTVYS